MKKGFTLIELIVVIAIISILAAIIAPNAFKAIEKAKISEAIGDFRAYKAGIYALYGDTGHWFGESTAPQVYIQMQSNNNNLAVNYSGWNGWDGPYVDKIKSRHPWKGWYVIQSSNCGGSTSAKEIWLEFEDACYGGSSSTCGMPRVSAQQIDRQIDTDNFATGDFRNCANWCYCSTNDYMWNFVWDAN